MAGSNISPGPDISLTPEQKEAATILDRHLSVSAGAGSGKTRVLVERYFNIIASGTEPSRILAITFTKKAAYEMRERIRKRLMELQSCAESAGDMASAEKWRRTRTQVETAPISTIHSFCASVLRSFPVEAGIDPGFVTLEDFEAQIMLSESIETAILAGLESGNKAVFDVLRRTQMGALKSELGRIYRAICTSGSKISDITLSVPHYEKSANDAAGNMRAIDDLVAQLSEARERESLPAATGAKVDCITGSWPALRRLVDEVLQGTPPDENGAFDGLLEFSRFCGGNVSKTVKPIVKGLKDTVDELTARLVDASIARLIPGIRDLIVLVDRLYSQRKAKAFCLDFEDLELRTKALLEHHPWIASHYSRRFDHIMVDEFQDTNSLQRDIIDLIRGSGPKPILFVVGDPKQSIYRFRGAEVEVFSRVQSDILRMGGDSRSLSQNFRSDRQITGFVNFVFEKLMSGNSAHPFDVTYERMQGRVEKAGVGAKQAAGSHVRSIPAGIEFLWALGTDGDQAPDLRAREAELIADKILALLDEGVEFGDIAVLFRAMTDVKIYERALDEVGIPYYVIGSRGFYQSTEIIDVLNCLRVIDNALDGLALAGALRSEMFGLSDETLYRIARLGATIADGVSSDASSTAAGPLVAGFWCGRVPEDLGTGEEEKLRRAREFFKAEREKKRCAGLSQVAEDVVVETGYAAFVLATRNGSQRYSNLQKFIATARDFEKRGFFGLGDFVKYIGDLTRMEAKEGEAHIETERGNTVKLMSVHQAKGLEFPVVIVADTTRSPSVSREAMFFVRGLGLGIKPGFIYNNEKLKVSNAFARFQELDEAKETAELKRIFYVAVTRAERRLIVSGGLKPPKGSSDAGSSEHGHVMSSGNSNAAPPVDSNAGSDVAGLDEPKPWADWLASVFGVGDWSLMDGQEVPVPDGEFSVRVTCALSQNEDVTAEGTYSDHLTMPVTIADEGETAAGQHGLGDSGGDGEDRENVEDVKDGEDGVDGENAGKNAVLKQIARQIAPVRWRRTEAACGLFRHYSVTGLSVYHICPRRYYFQYVLNLEGSIARMYFDPVTGQPGADFLAGRRTSVVERLGAVELGNIVHRVCARISVMDELDNALDEAVLKELGLARKVLEPNAGANLAGTQLFSRAREEARKVLSNYLASPIFAKISQSAASILDPAASVPSVMSEKALTWRSGEFLVMGVVDKLWVDPDGTMNIVDFKANRVEETEVDALLEEYGFQMGCYLTGIRKSFPQNRLGSAQLYFLYPNVTREVQLKDDLEDRVIEYCRSIETSATLADFPKTARTRDHCPTCPYLGVCGQL